MQAYLSKSRVRLAAAFALVAMALWTARHLITAVHIGSLIDYLYSYWILIVSFLVLVITIGLSYRERPKTSAAPTGSDAHVAAIIPAYNEDPAALQECIRSLFAQTRPPQEIYVVDDGSRVEYSTVAQWAGTQAGKHGSAIKWLRQDNSGKRHAQAHAIAKADQATIFITVDSDSVLDRHAIAELLKPFADPDVQSVAGLVLARNNRTNLLAPRVSHFQHRIRAASASWMPGFMTSQSCWYMVAWSMSLLWCFRTQVSKESPMWFRWARPVLA